MSDIVSMKSLTQIYLFITLTIVLIACSSNNGPSRGIASPAAECSIVKNPASNTWKIVLTNGKNLNHFWYKRKDVKLIEKQLKASDICP